MNPLRRVRRVVRKLTGADRRRIKRRLRMYVGDGAYPRPKHRRRR